MNWSEIWWRDIAGPAGYVKMVVDALNEGNQVMMCLPRDIPWKHELRSHVELLYKDTGGDAVFETIDCVDEFGEDENVGLNLLKKLSNADVYRNYRNFEDVFQYMARNGVFDKKILWLKGIPEKKLKFGIMLVQSIPKLSSVDVLEVISAWK